MALVQMIQLFLARAGLADQLIDLSPLQKLPRLFRRFDRQTRACPDALLRLVPDLHELQPALPETIQVATDLVIKRQGLASHRNLEVRVGRWQRLVPLPQSVELVHERNGPLAETLKLCLDTVLQLQLAPVKQCKGHQAKQAE